MPLPVRSPRLTVRDLLVESLTWIVRRRTRSLLTALGTLLGVAAFVSTIGITSTVSAQVSEKFDLLKATAVVVQQTEPGTNAVPDDYADRLGRLNGVVASGLFRRLNSGQSMEVRTGPSPDRTEAVPVLSASPGALTAAGARVSAGRLFDEGHVRRGDRVALLGSGAAKILGITDLGRRPGIFVGGRAYAVIGIVDGADRLDELVASVVFPEGAASRALQGEDSMQNVLIHTDLGAANLIGRQAPQALRPDRPEAFTVVMPPDPQTLRQKVEGDLRMLFLLLAAVSLTIGAVGIANTTLVSVMERVPEIGLRRSLGAQRRHIAYQFLVESTALGCLGGVLGCVLAVYIVVGTSLVKSWSPVLNPVLVLAAPLLGTLTGLLAGLYPALKAARITPVHALNR